MSKASTRQWQSVKYSRCRDGGTWVHLEQEIGVRLDGRQLLVETDKDGGNLENLALDAKSLGKSQLKGLRKGAAIGFRYEEKDKTRKFQLKFSTETFATAFQSAVGQFVSIRDIAEQQDGQRQNGPSAEKKPEATQKAEQNGKAPPQAIRQSSLRAGSAYMSLAQPSFVLSQPFQSAFVPACQPTASHPQDDSRSDSVGSTRFSQSQIQHMPSPVAGQALPMILGQTPTEQPWSQPIYFNAPQNVEYMSQQPQMVLVPSSPALHHDNKIVTTPVRSTPMHGHMMQGGQIFQTPTSAYRVGNEVFFASQASPLLQRTGPPLVMQHPSPLVASQAVQDGMSQAQDSGPSQLAADAAIPMSQKRHIEDDPMKAALPGEPISESARKRPRTDAGQRPAPQPVQQNAGDKDLGLEKSAEQSDARVSTDTQTGGGSGASAQAVLTGPGIGVEGDLLSAFQSIANVIGRQNQVPKPETAEEELARPTKKCAS
ncbi:hypothetical protein DFJ74DRAFT_327652 [Hyaloraphidium curvatum]|nr:hypothetical protein DFJ74DRAFT_327652 [Hyaloraphidium curvatum]